MYHIQNPSFHLFILCVSIHILSWQPAKACVCSCWIAVYSYSCSVVWQCCSLETAAFWLLCDITCCCHCNNLIMPSKGAALHVLPDWWDWTCECEGSEIMWRPRAPLRPGAAPVMNDSAEQGGLPQGWRCQHAPSPTSSCPDECKIDKDSLLCTDKGETQWLPQQLLMLVWGK